MDNEQGTMNNEELEFTEDVSENIPCECQGELDDLRRRIDMLTKDNAELITDNLTLRAKAEALLQARAALPEFSVPTEANPDKYAGIREAFKNANSFLKKK